MAAHYGSFLCLCLFCLALFLLCPSLSVPLLCQFFSVFSLLAHNHLVLVREFFVTRRTFNLFFSLSPVLSVPLFIGLLMCLSYCLCLKPRLCNFEWVTKKKIITNQGINSSASVRPSVILSSSFACQFTCMSTCLTFLFMELGIRYQEVEDHDMGRTVYLPVVLPACLLLCFHLLLLCFLVCCSATPFVWGTVEAGRNATQNSIR